MLMWSLKLYKNMPRDIYNNIKDVMVLYQNLYKLNLQLAGSYSLSLNHFCLEKKNQQLMYTTQISLVRGSAEVNPVKEIWN